MPYVPIQSDRPEMVESFEICIGGNKYSAHFGRKVPITDVVRMIRAWLSGIERGDFKEPSE